MYRSGGRVLSKYLTLRQATSNSYLSSFNSSCIENIPDISGFWCVAKAFFLILFLEDYYV
jgi:hypothetical protein